MKTLISNFSLSRADIDSFPPKLREKFSVPLDELGSKEVQVVLIKSKDDLACNAFKKIFETTVRIFDDRSTTRSERNIERLVDLFLDRQPRAEVDIQIERDNAVMRADYLRRTPVLSAAELCGQFVAEFQYDTALVSSWKKEGKIFAIKVNGVEKFPIFQFSEGSPKPVIEKILKILPNEMSAWQIALWFDSPNSWLDEMSPIESLNDHDGVLDAARQEGEGIVG
ncbi:hypothetical protein [Arenicella sp. 4NH20-0111]|uniref:hypothetical protein n=1 Tax=Arenicella sp. 4NH20-0111 TaxID=3127648 RepID=UPI0033428FE9